MRIRACVAVVAAAVFTSGCGAGGPSEKDAQTCRAMLSVQASYDETKDQVSDLRAAVLQDYVALPGNLPSADDAKLEDALAGARGKQAEAQGTIPVDGGRVMEEALRPAVERCRALGPGQK